VAGLLGIIMLETRFPRIPGDIGNPETFTFPVRKVVVHGASPQRVVMEADPTLLAPFIAAGWELIAEGATLLTTSCGFLALFQREMAAALPVPVLTSSLLQVAPVAATLQPGQKVGILTANGAALTPRHLEAVGASAVDTVIVGLEETREFAQVFLHNQETLNVAAARAEVLAAGRQLMTNHPDVGALVLECTNLPPFADDLRQLTGLPVFDITTLVNWAWAATKGGSAHGG
jgi:hypothetical protein